MNLSPLIQDFVLHFGEMGSKWGINRTVGQIYALIFVSNAPLNADDLTDKLAISRSNVSMGLKELQAWRLVRLHHVQGDRREYFTAPDDIWEIFRTVAQERRRREIDPTLTMLRTALVQEVVTSEDLHAQDRIRQMHELFEVSTKWFDEVQSLDPTTLITLMQLGAQVSKLVSTAQSIKAKLTGAADPE